MEIREDLLHFIWKMQLFKLQEQITTTKGHPVRVVQTGIHNHNQGPDFHNAQIRIDNTLWAGHVEIHIKSSDWYRHNHHTDKTYQSVILHVVYEHDREVYIGNSPEPLPVLELKKYLNKALVDKHLLLINNMQWISCANHIHDIPTVHKQFMLEKMLVERLQSRTLNINNLLAKNQNDWAETFYQQLAKNFGLKINSEAFEMLAKSIHSNILAKHKDHLMQIEALLFGQAGMLNTLYNIDEPYVVNLKKEYRFLSKKYALKPLNVRHWNYLRLRPSNFPTIRLSQFAALIHRSSHLFSKILETKSIKSCRELFDVNASEYWDSHYKFNKTVNKNNVKTLGKSTIDNILCNTVVSFLFAYGHIKKKQFYKDRALNFLENLPAEHNRVTKKWGDYSLKNENAYHSQGLIQLKNNYCDRKRCLDCHIGGRILTG